ncbi:transposase [Acetobacter estunensis]|uniref:transposase n=1 Tax=Acetobacter estunensis TaxID=104097 RepID=UPI0020C3B37D|nr:transposase [Acetobacter estunensis]
MILNGLQWKRCPERVWSAQDFIQPLHTMESPGVFDRIFVVLTEQTGCSKHLMIDATHLKAHRTVAFLLLKRGFSPPYRTDKRRTELKIHAVCDGEGRVVRLHLTAGQVSDFKGADVLLAYFPDETEEVIGDRGYDSNRIRLSLAKRNITACIPPKKEPKIKAALQLTSV